MFHQYQISYILLIIYFFHFMQKIKDNIEKRKKIFFMKEKFDLIFNPIKYKCVQMLLKILFIFFLQLIYVVMNLTMVYLIIRN